MMHVSSQAVRQKLYLNGMGVEGIILGMANPPDVRNCFSC